MGCLALITEALLLVAALVFFVLAAFLGPNSEFHETFATLATSRQDDLTDALACGVALLTAAIVIEMFRRKSRRR